MITYPHVRVPTSALRDFQSVVAEWDLERSPEAKPGDHINDTKYSSTSSGAMVRVRGDPESERGGGNQNAVWK